MTPEASAVLRALRDELDKLPADLVGPVERVGEVLSVFGGRMRLGATVIHDPGIHPSIAHAHVVAEIGAPGSAAAEPVRLDACVMGVDADHQIALAGCARHWTAAVAGPLFSLLHARPVLGAAHFGGSEPFGVAGCHGFVGPLVARMFEKEVDLSALEDAGLFDYADAFAPPGLVHLAKVTLEATEGAWHRTLAIDGHEVVHPDADWHAALAAPAHGVVSQFAVFHYADNPGAVDERRGVDDAVRQFVRAFHEAGTTDAAAALLESRGVPPGLVDRLEPFVPLALGRALVGDMGPKFSADYLRVRADGGAERLRLMREPVFARTSALVPELMSGELAEPARTLALAGSEIHAFNAALNAGSKPYNLVLFPPVIPDRGAGPELVDRAVRQLHEQPPPPRQPPGPPRRTESPPATPHEEKKRARPWWRFW
jgi:hypothetical protein